MASRSESVTWRPSRVKRALTRSLQVSFKAISGTFFVTLAPAEDVNYCQCMLEGVDRICHRPIRLVMLGYPHFDKRLLHFRLNSTFGMTGEISRASATLHKGISLQNTRLVRHSERVGVLQPLITLLSGLKDGLNEDADVKRHNNYVRYCEY